MLFYLTVRKRPALTPRCLCGLWEINRAFPAFDKVGSVLGGIPVPLEITVSKLGGHATRSTSPSPLTCSAPAPLPGWVAGCSERPSFPLIPKDCILCSLSFLPLSALKSRGCLPPHSPLTSFPRCFASRCSLPEAMSCGCPPFWTL